MERLTTRHNGHPAMARGYKERFTESSLFYMLLNRLTEYEDTGLSPEEIKEFLEDVEMRYVLWIEKRWGISVCRHNDIMNAEKDGRLEILPPNDPLTLKELREMDGEPVYLPGGNCWVLVTFNGFASVFSWPDGSNCSAADWYNQVGPAYRRRPE